MPGDTLTSPALGPDGFPKATWTPPDPGVQVAPVSAAVASAASPVAQPLAPKAAAEIRYLSGRPRSEVYDLLEPVAVDGVEIRQVEIRRLSTGQINDFIDLVRASPQAGGSRFPLFYRTDGALLTDDEWNALDPDDTDALSEKGDRFLPVRFRSGRTSEPSSRTGSVSSGSSSDASPTAA